MNLCGADYEQQVHEVNVSATSFHCGPCVKEDGSHLDSVFSEEVIDTALSDKEDAIEQPKKNPLDVIEEQLTCDLTGDVREINQERRTTVGVHDSPPIRSLMSYNSLTTATTTATISSGRPRQRGHLTPSPVRLNPLSMEDWSAPKELSIPVLREDDIKRSASGSIDGLMKRLEKGFSVRLFLHSGSSEDLLLYYDSRRHRLCLRGDEEEKKTDGVINFWQELPIARILRLEIDRKSRKSKNSLLSFSLVLDSEKAEGHTCYDFEAKSPIEREIIVATLMVVLEKSHEDIGQSHVEEEIDRYDVADYVDIGTSDQPIACSPSLEEHQVMQGQYSPRRTTSSLKGQSGGTEAGLVIHLEHLDDSTVSSPKLETLRLKTLSQNDLTVGIPALPGSEDLLSDCKSTKQMTSAWCADDICTLALKDIADSCAGIFVLKQAEAGMCNVSGITEEQRLMIEEYIASALGAPSAVFSYLSDADVWKSRTVETVSNEYLDQTASQGRIRNRASVLNAQSDRLKSLRQEMTFAAALKASQERMTLQTTQSFDDARMLRSRSLEKEVANKFHSSALLKHVVGNMMLSSSAEAENDIAFYDSDPEDTRPRAVKDPRQISINMQRQQKASSEKHKRALSGPGFNKIKGSSKRVSRKLDEEAIVQIVQQMTNERLTLIWHQTQCKTLPNRSPMCVKMWIESGVCLIDGTFILPKLSWTQYETQAASGRRIERTEPEKLDLLDICRILTAESIDRRRHPFAVARRSFQIETQSEAYMFEAQTPEECERIVFGLKLVIARLASLLMLRDGRAAEEFFGAVAAHVPGEAPTWTRGENQDSSSGDASTAAAPALR